MDTSKEVTNCDRSRYFQLIFVVQIRFEATQKRFSQICGREKSSYLQIEWVKNTDVTTLQLKWQCFADERCT